jgi:hypothetical protein
MGAKFEINKDKSGEYRFKLIVGNGQALNPSRRTPPKLPSKTRRPSSGKQYLTNRESGSFCRQRSSHCGSSALKGVDW